MNASQKQSARKFVELWTFRRGSESGEVASGLIGDHDDVSWKKWDESGKHDVM